MLEAEEFNMMTLVQAKQQKSVGGWVEFFKVAEIPVFRQTHDALEALRLHEDEVGANQIAAAVIHDPLMMFKILSYANNHRSRYQLQDLVQVEQAIIMMGTATFFSHIPHQPLVEDVLKAHFDSLMDILKLLVRAHRASFFAAEFASHLKDLHAEELRVAACLHDVAEMLMWCFNQEEMHVIVQRQEADKTLRSKVVQEEVLGFKLVDLQAELVREFNLPHVLTDLLDERQAHVQRVRNVQLAVNLARHSADGWDNLALPDDYQDIAQLLHVDIPRVMHIIGVKHEAGVAG